MITGAPPTLFTNTQMAVPRAGMGTKASSSYQRGVGSTSKAFSQTGRVEIRFKLYDSQGKVIITGGTASSLDKKV